MLTTILTFLKSNVYTLILLALLGVYTGYLKYSSLSDARDYESQISELKTEVSSKEVQNSTLIQRYDSLNLENEKLKINLDSFNTLLEEKNKTIENLEEYINEEIKKVLNLKIATKEEQGRYDIISKESSDSILKDINNILSNTK